jgi:hypothetical protein
MLGYGIPNQPITVTATPETPEKKALTEAQKAARAVAGRVVRVLGNNRAGRLLNEQLEWLATPTWHGEVDRLRLFTADVTELLDLVELGKAAAKQAGEAA